MELIINIYLLIALFTFIVSGFGLLIGLEFEVEINNFWDWIIYSLCWIIHPLKSLIKLIKNMFN